MIGISAEHSSQIAGKRAIRNLTLKEKRERFYRCK